jgi:hypothetical protein
MSTDNLHLLVNKNNLSHSIIDDPSDIDHSKKL